MAIFCQILIFFSCLTQSLSNDNVERTIINFSYFQKSSYDKPAYDAVLYHGIKYKMFVVSANEGYMKIKFKVWIDFIPAKSHFVKRDSVNDALLLKHEQGHADVSTIQARSLLLSLNATKYRIADYKKQINDIFISHLNAAGKEHAAYDEETSHGSNTENQKSYDKKFDLYFNTIK